MTEQAQNYRIINPTTLDDLANQVNRIFALMADRADGQEGRRGTPTFYNTVDMNNNRATSGAAAVDDNDLPVFSQLSTMAAIVGAVYPVGSIYVSVVSTNPGTLFGVGTWVAFGTGRVMVGINAADADFDTVEETGGAKTYALAAHNHTTPAHQHPDGTLVDNDGALSTVQVKDGNGGDGTTGNGGAATVTTMPPYIVVYMFKRTA